MRPLRLTDLGPVFDRLEEGESVLLGEEATNPPAPPDRDEPWLGFFSSGSSRSRSLTWRRWSDLLADTTSATKFKGWTWASPFRADSYAGIQVALQAWRSGGRVVPLDQNCEQVWEVIRSESVDVLCCTPTYLDVLLQMKSSAGNPHRQPEQKGDLNPLGCALRQVTVGGEIFNPLLGRRVVAQLTGCRITVIYATSELGVLMKTNRVDGWFEMASLERRFPRWKVCEGQLLVWRSPRWVGTGDLVVAEGPLMRVLGRADRVANVSGTKVDLNEVSALAEEVPGVRRAVAVAQSSEITGQIVCLRFSVEDEDRAPEIEARLQQTLRQRLRKEAWPRNWVRDVVGPEVNGKRRISNA